jgi:hypothetical protein
MMHETARHAIHSFETLGVSAETVEAMLLHPSEKAVAMQKPRTKFRHTSPLRFGCFGAYSYVLNRIKSGYRTRLLL